MKRIVYIVALVLLSTEAWAKKKKKSLKLTPSTKQAVSLYQDDLEILASIYAAKAIDVEKNPTSRRMKVNWEILFKVDDDEPITNLLTTLAAAEHLSKVESVPYFKNDWNFYRGLSAYHRGKTKLASKIFKKLKPSDKHFISGRYLSTMTLIDRGQLEEADAQLHGLLDVLDAQAYEHDSDNERELIDLIHLAIARIAYEQREFKKSVEYFRKIENHSPYFYDALMEQSWALFLRGRPSHALGVLNGVTSPFYTQVYNPEAKVLQSIIHYWLCRYDDSRNALADFVETYEDGVKGLKSFLKRKKLNARKAYELFENLAAGVSSKSLGIERSILETAAESEAVLRVRSQLAMLVEEEMRLAKAYSGKKKVQFTKVLSSWKASMQRALGRRFLQQLRMQAAEFNDLYEQAQLLYVELLMSEKDKKLGKNLHASTKFMSAKSSSAVEGWAGESQSWGGTTKDEYWFDEVGFQIQNVRSECIKK